MSNINARTASLNYRAKVATVLSFASIVPAVDTVIAKEAGKFDGTEKQLVIARAKLGGDFARNADKAKLLTIRNAANVCKTVEDMLSTIKREACEASDWEDGVDAACLDANTLAKIAKVKAHVDSIRNSLEEIRNAKKPILANKAA